MTGAELTDVTAAVEAHDEALTVESVRKDPDGSYDVFGTEDGEPVALDVGADLTTFTERASDGDRGDRGDRGGPCGAGDHGERGDRGPDGPGADDGATGADAEQGTGTPS